MGVTLQTVDTSGHQGTQDWQRMQGPHSSPSLITKASVDWLPSIHASVPPRGTQFLKSVGHFLPMKPLCFRRTSSFAHLERWGLMSLNKFHLARSSDQPPTREWAHDLS